MFFFSCYWFLQNRARSPPVASEPLGYGQRHDATVDIPLDTTNVMSLLIQRLYLKTVRFFLDGLILFSMIYFIGLEEKRSGASSLGSRFKTEREGRFYN